MTRFPPAVLAAIAREAEASPTREVCGLVFREPDGSLRSDAVENAADRWAAADPARFPGGARDGYLMDPRSLREALSAAEQRGATLAAVYHSHVEAEAYFSRRDVDEALVDGEPLLPGVDYLVMAVRGGRVAATRCFHWNGGRFEEVPVGGSWA